MFARSFHRVLHALVMLGILCHGTANEDFAYVVLSAPFVLASYFINAGGRSSPLPQWLVGVLLLGATAHMGFSWVGDIENTVGILARYVIILQIVKLFDCRSARDRAQVMGLSFMLVVAAMLTSVKLATGVCILAYIGVLTLAVAGHQVLSGAERAGRPIARDEPPRGAARPVRDLRRVAFSAMLGAVAIGAVVFIIVPRGVGANVLGAYQPPTIDANVTRFRDSVQLGQEGFITQSQRPVLTMKLTASHDAVRLGQPIRLRGSVLDGYDPARRKWERSLTQQTGAYPLAEGDLPPPATMQHRAMVRLEIEQLPTERSRREYLFSMLKPIGFSSENRGRTNWSRWNDILIARRSERTELLTDATGARSYTVYCDPYYRPTEGTEPTPIPKHPFGTGPVRDLARQIVDRRNLSVGGEEWAVRNKEPVARAIRDFLQSEYRYSLSMTAPAPGQDPIEMFLFQTKEGHCEYFAAAMTAMCLSLDINARYVTGYLASEFDRETGVYTVRESDAHAWVEVETQPGMWREFDPTPPDDLALAHNDRPSLGAMWMRFLSSMEIAWSQGVISYDQDTQEQAVGARRDPFGLYGWMDRQLRAMQEGRDSPSRARDLLALGAAWGAALLLAGAGLALLLTARGAVLDSLRAFLAAIGLRMRGLFSPGTRSAAAAELQYQRLWRELARRGFVRPPATPALEFARSMAPADPRAAAVTERVSSLYYRARFAPTAPSLEEIDAAARQLSEWKRAR